MQDAQCKPIWSGFSNFFTNIQADTKKPTTKMRPLSDAELLAVAGGPELEVGNGQ